MKFPKDMIKASNALMVAVAVFAFGHAPAAKAQWVVTDPGNTLNTYMTQFQQFNEMKNTFERWKDTYSHMQQQIASVQSTIGQVKSVFTPGSGFERLQTIPEDFGVEARCGGGPSGLAGIKRDIVSGISNITNDSYVNLVAEQRRLCRAIRIMQNQKINASVVMINERMPDLTKAYERIVANYDASSGAQTQGNQAQFSADIESAKVELDSALAQYEHVQRQYDAYIDVYTSRQRSIAEVIMRGPGTNGKFGAVVRTTAVAGALGVNLSDLIP